jgi:hypothetical protein
VIVVVVLPGGGCNRRDDTVVCVLTPVLQLQGFAQLGLLRHASALLPLHRQIHGHTACALLIHFIPHPLKTKDIACSCPIISVVLGRNRLRRQRRRPTAMPLRRRLQLPPPKTHIVSICHLHNQQRDACPALCFSLRPSMFVLLICCSFALAAVIEGWRQALRHMSEGENGVTLMMMPAFNAASAMLARRMCIVALLRFARRVTQRAGDMWDIWLPSSLAYGDEGRGVMIGVCACMCVVCLC